jgi:dihydrofolate reductase
MATSLNGNITFGGNSTDWVDKADWKYFYKITKDSKVIIMGSETFKQFADDFPQKQALNVVVTTKTELLNKKIDGAIFTDKSPKEIIKMLSNKGYKETCLIGGEKLNTSFIKDNLVDEIYVDIHPYIIGEGLRMFGSIDKMFKKLKLKDIKKLGKGLVLLHYLVEN